MENRLYVILTITNKCNLHCRYCYEDKKNLDEMSYSVGKRIIAEAMSDTNYDSVEFDFHGGEPFLNFPLIKKLCEWAWHEYNKRIIYFFTTTNGTVLTAEMKEWLESNKSRFCAALSLDGTPKMNYENRGVVIPSANLDFFLKLWPEQPIKLTISKETISSIAEGICFVHATGFHISANLAYGIDWEAELVDTYKRELDKLVEYYCLHREIKPCSIFEKTLIPVLKEEMIIRHCGAGNKMRAYDTEGRCYPCQMFVPNALDKDKWEEISKLDFKNNDSYFGDGTCKGCMIHNICPTCYGNNYLERGSIGKRDKRLCLFVVAEKIALSKYKVKTLQEKSFEDFDEMDYLELKAAKRILDYYKTERL